MKLMGMGMALAIGAALVVVPVQAKPLDACTAEYAANKAKIDGKQSQADFVAACLKGQETIDGATTSAKPAVPPSVADKQPATPAKSAGEAQKPAAAP